MIDAHFHRQTYATFFEGGPFAVRFCGVHPWQLEANDFALESALEAMAGRLQADERLAVGEIGLDRLHSPDAQLFAREREVFARQLDLAAQFARPVVLHGAKCWGEVVKMCLLYRGRIPAFLFHGFSRSIGLIGDIMRLNGFISVGPAITNAHALNYRAMVAELPPDRVLAETDFDDDASPDERRAMLERVYNDFALLRGLTVAELSAELRANAARFLGRLGRVE